MAPTGSALPDTEPQTAAGKVLRHVTMSLDGFVAGPNHSMDRMRGSPSRAGLIEEYAVTTGAVLGGQDGFDAIPDVSTDYGGAWDEPVCFLTHHLEDAAPTDGVAFLTCDVAEAARIDLHVAPVLLGDGIRLFDNPGGSPVCLELLNGDDRPAQLVNLRYRPLTSGYQL